MDDYISRQAAMNAFAEYVRRSNNSDFAPTPTWNDAVEIVKNLPSAGVQPVRNGHWIRHLEQKNIFGGKCVECSECGEKYVVQYIEDEKYCRNCGARMDGEQNG